MTTALSVLKEARRLIKDVGWTQGHFWQLGDNNRPNCFCSLGAIEWAADKRCSRPGVYGVIRTAGEIFSQAVARDDMDSVADWNDHPERTKAEVIDAFDRAIELAASEASQQEAEK